MEQEGLRPLASAGTNTYRAKAGETCRGLAAVGPSVLSSSVEAVGAVCGAGHCEPHSLLPRGCCR